MSNYNSYEIEEFLNADMNEKNNKVNETSNKRKWREIENFKEKQRLRRELLEYSQYGL